jgi:hypothetical protein
MIALIRIHALVRLPRVLVYIGLASEAVSIACGRRGEALFKQPIPERGGVERRYRIKDA